MTSDSSYLWALKLERNETLHMHVQHGKSLQHVQCGSRWRRRISWMQQTLGQKVRSTRHNTAEYDGELGTPFYGVTSWLVPVSPLRPHTPASVWTIHLAILAASAVECIHGGIIHQARGCQTVQNVSEKHAPSELAATANMHRPSKCSNF